MAKKKRLQMQKKSSTGVEHWFDKPKKIARGDDASQVLGVGGFGLFEDMTQDELLALSEILDDDWPVDE